MTTPASALPDSATTTPNLALNHVTIRFPRPGNEPLTIVEDFNLALERGHMHCLAGRSGSGKTSLLRVAAHFSRPSNGEVLWAGRPVTDMTDAERARARHKLMGYVDQAAPAIAELTALDNALLPAVPAGLTATVVERATALLTTFGLGDRLRTRAARLSGGERQRVALARAMLTAPSTLAVDEPTANLDRASAATVIEALRRIADDGAAVLIATHDPNLVAAADSVTTLE